MQASQLVDKAYDILCLGKYAVHAHMARCLRQCSTPRTRICVIDAIFRDRIDFGITGYQVTIKGIDILMHKDNFDSIFAQITMRSNISSLVLLALCLAVAVSAVAAAAEGASFLSES